MYNDSLGVSHRLPGSPVTSISLLQTSPSNLPQFLLPTYTKPIQNLDTRSWHRSAQHPIYPYLEFSNASKQELCYITKGQFFWTPCINHHGVFLSVMMMNAYSHHIESYEFSLNNLHK